jgi:hypothetical protein
MKITLFWHVTHVAWLRGTHISEESNDSIFGSSTLKLRAAGSSEMLISFYQTTWQEMSEETNLHILSCEDLQSKIAWQFKNQQT